PWRFAIAEAGFFRYTAFSTNDSEAWHNYAASMPLSRLQRLRRRPRRLHPRSRDRSPQWACPRQPGSAPSEFPREIRGGVCRGDAHSPPCAAGGGGAGA
ncbi:unnamed protein product, partial [Phaeothamnion confervicola]